MKKILILIILSIMLISCSNSGTTDNSNGNYDELAKCITDSGARMYGAYWCSNCVVQKQMFGKSWKEINYIECSLPNRQGQTQICTLASINAYPTWEFVDGTRMSGQQSLEDLAERTGCEI